VELKDLNVSGVLLYRLDIIVRCVLAVAEHWKRRGGGVDAGDSEAGAWKTRSLPDQRAEQRGSERGEGDGTTS